jgi:hypothetical protein
MKYRVPPRTWQRNSSKLFWRCKMSADVRVSDRIQSLRKQRTRAVATSSTASAVLKSGCGVAEMSAMILSTLAFVAVPVKAGAACDLCSGTLSHRSGPFKLQLSTENNIFKRGAPIVVYIKIINRSSRAMIVNLSQTVKQVSMHIVSDRFKSSQGDSPVITVGGKPVKPGSFASFGPRALQQWPNSYVRSVGTYKMNVSYDRVDSNTVSFRVTQ